MQESPALIKEVSHCRRDQHCLKRSARLCARGQVNSAQKVRSALHKRSAHLGELSSDQIGQLSFAQEVRSALHKRSTHPGELSSDQRGQLG